MQKVGETYYSGPLHIADENGDPVDSLVSADFVKQLYLNGLPITGVAVTVTLLSNGNYQATFIPNAAGSWTLIITQATYAPDGFAEPIQVWPYPYLPVPSEDFSSFLLSVTTTDFRNYFTRDFPYLLPFNVNKVYFKDEQVSYLTGNTTNFYKMLLTSATGILPTDVTDPPTWEAVQVDQSKYIVDFDIQKSFNQSINFTNPDIFENAQVLLDAYYYCTAHFLAMDMRMAESGIDSRGEGLISSKSVGSVSVSYSVPDRFQKDSFDAYFAQTGYGQKFLAYVQPRVTGNIGTAGGDTNP
jgi:hypothetical protein